MAGPIDWLYHRKNCVSCERARSFIDEHELKVKSDADARTDRRGPDEALALAHAANTIHIARGKKLVTFDMKRAAPDDETLLAHLLGPSGNLRAPTIVKGKALYVGFSDEAYQALL